MTIHVRRALACLICAPLLAMPNTLTAATTPERSTLGEADKWDLSPMYANSQAWEEHYRELEGMIAKCEQRRAPPQNLPRPCLR
jgi:hypothetical protein